MQFDTAEALEAIGHPTFVHEGLTYHGKNISLPEWVKYVDAVDKLQASELGMIRRHILYRELLGKWFPAPRRRGVFPFRRRGQFMAESETGEQVPSPHRQGYPRDRSVADIVMSLEIALQNEAMAAFFRSQARAFNPRLKRATVTTESTS